MEDWEKEALAEVAEEWIPQAHPNLNGVQLKEFVSKSNGRGRKKRKRLREITLVTFGKRTFAIGTKLTRSLEYLLKDIFPEPVDVISDGDWIAEFIQASRKRKTVKKKKN